VITNLGVRKVAVLAIATAIGAVELAALNAFAVREVTWSIPTAYDQAWYGVQAFALHRAIRELGLLPAVWQYLGQPSPQGWMLQLQGAVACLVFGRGWLRLLNVNFVYFLLFQAATAYAAWYVTGRRLWWALTAVGLTLAFATPYFWAGGLMDFRLDFAAFCLYGIFIAAVVRSDVFASRRWSFAAAVVAVLLIFHRTLTVTYLVGTVAALSAYLVFSRQPGSRARLHHLAYATAAVFVCALPILAIQSTHLYQYYWVGHVSGEEAGIRAREQGLSTLGDHLGFYVSSLFGTHLARAFLAAAAVLVLGAVAMRAGGRSDARRAPDAGLVPAATPMFCALCLVVPMIILTADVSKSPVVVGITGPAVLWLVIVGSLALGGAQLVDGRAGRVIALAVLLIGVAHTSWTLTRSLDRLHPGHGYPRQDVERLLGVYDMLVSAATRQEVPPGGLSVFGNYEYVNAEVAKFLAYERHGVALGVGGQLGHTLFAESRPTMTAKIDGSAFVATTPQRPVEEFVSPGDRTLQPVIPELTRYVRERFIRMTSFRLGPQEFELYRRPLVRLHGVSGDWITSAGAVAEIREEDKAAAVTLLLHGRSNMSLVPGVAVSAAALELGATTPGRALPTDLRVNGDDYVIAVSLAGLTEGPGPLLIRLSFSKYFVPRLLGLNDDPRKLVIQPPYERTILFRRTDAAVSMRATSCSSTN